MSSSPEKMKNPEEIALLTGRSYTLGRLWIDIKEVLDGPRLCKTREEVNLQPSKMKVWLKADSRSLIFG